MHVQNKKNGIMDISRNEAVHSQYIIIAYILLHQGNDIDFVHSVANYNSDRVTYPTFQIYYRMLLSLK